VAKSIRFISNIVYIPRSSKAHCLDEFKQINYAPVRRGRQGEEAQRTRVREHSETAA